MAYPQTQTLLKSLGLNPSVISADGLTPTTYHEFIVSNGKLKFDNNTGNAQYVVREWPTGQAERIWASLIAEAPSLSGEYK